MKLTHDDHSADNAHEFELTHVIHGEVVHDEVHWSDDALRNVLIVVFVLVVLVGALMLRAGIVRLW